MALDGAAEVGGLLRAVGERPGRAVRVQAQVVGAARLVVEPDVAVEAQLGGAAREPGDGDAVAEHVVQPAQLDRRRRDLQPRLQDALVVPFARAEHHAVLAEGDGLAVAVGGDVADGEERHSGCDRPSSGAGEGAAGAATTRIPDRLADWDCDLRLRPGRPGLRLRLALRRRGRRTCRRGRRSTAMSCALEQVQELVQPLLQDLADGHRRRARSRSRSSSSAAPSRRAARGASAGVPSSAPASRTQSATERGKPAVEQQEARHPRRGDAFRVELRGTPGSRRPSAAARSTGSRPAASRRPPGSGSSRWYLMSSRRVVWSARSM